jgi:hypothetical protein
MHFPRNAILMLSGLAGFAAEPGMRVWVAEDLVRVRPWDGPRTAQVAMLKAARNEYAPFQVVVRAGERALRNVNARASLPGFPVTLYREQYVEVTTPSPKSKEGASWYPDALIPLLEAPPEKARFVGAPFEVPPGMNQPLWVDVYVPKDAAPGEYSGTLTVTAQEQAPAAATVAIRLTVWDFTLPETPTLRTSFGNASRAAAWYKLASDSAEARALDRQFAEILAAHRLCAPIPSYLRPVAKADGSIDPASTHPALKEWMERFHVTGFPVSLQGRDPLGQDRERNVHYLRAMWQYLEENGWEKYAYVYVLDEPNDAAAYEEVRQRAQFIHVTQPGLKVLCTEQPTPQNAAWGSLVGSIDIWVPLWHLFEEQAGPERLAAGEELWSYTALCQGPKGRDTPFWQLDFPPLNYRIPMWTNWRFGMTGLLYWTAVYWDPSIDIWKVPLSFRNAYNYEGLLLFPGGEAGLGGFLPSVRLKQIREGIEDYEYFNLLTQAGEKAAADQVVGWLARSWTDWDEDPGHLYAARERIAELILKASAATAKRRRPAR